MGDVDGGHRVPEDREGEEAALGLVIKGGEERSSVAIKMLFHHVAVEKLG